MKAGIIYALIIFLAACDSPAVEEKGLPLETGITNSDFRHTIAFGSCNRSDLAQPLWKDIHACHPDVFVWLGDNIYGDSRDTSVLSARYAAQMENESYRDFAASVPVIGTWDDHDYGENDAGSSYPSKKGSRDLALRFLGVPQSNPVWQREGLYQSYTPVPVIKVILLDCRYFRDDLKTSFGVIRESGGDILGAGQWKWLEAELTAAKGEFLVIIASSIQVIPTEHAYEKWANFPASRERLLELVYQSGLANTVFISGDRHMGELSCLPYKDKTYFEVTSSGLTHFWENMPSEKNRFRRGQVVNQLNFGLIEVSGTMQLPEITLQIRGEGNTILRSLRIPVKPQQPASQAQPSLSEPVQAMKSL